MKTRLNCAIAASLLAATAPVADVRAQPLTREERAAHTLSRLTFGARHGDLDRVLAMGLDRWIDRQLRPTRSSDSVIAAEMNRLPLWYGALPDLARTPPGIGGAIRIPADTDALAMDATGRRLPDTTVIRLALERTVKLGTQAYMGRVVRADASETQLLEVLTDFWQNHFSVYGPVLPSRGVLMTWDAYTLRPHALGKFRDLLGAAARSPAILLYLDNSTSGADSGRMTLPEHESIKRFGTPGNRLPYPGMNENYARELLELHTLGVDGGYSQGDVINVARAFTGWGVNVGGESGYRAFLFRDYRHDAEEKTVLGKVLPAGRGMEDGEEVLDMLARHPSTARFIARKLAVRFVSDNPPDSLVGRAAATFVRTDGDIAEVMRTILRSPEFFSRDAFRAKVKSPLEFVFSMRRAFNAPFDTAQEAVEMVDRLGQPMYGRTTPDGWPEAGAPWLNVETMFIRIGYAQSLAQDQLPSIPLSRSNLWREMRGRSFDEQLAGVIRHLLGGSTSPETRVILASARPPASASDIRRVTALRELIGLALASPEFQRR